MEPKGSQYEPEGCQKGPNMSQKGAKMTPKVPKGLPESDQNTTKNRNLEKGRKKGCAGLSFRLSFDILLVKKCVQKSMRKTMAKKTKSMKIKQKTGYDSIPRNAFSHRLSAKAVPPK